MKLEPSLLPFQRLLAFFCINLALTGIAPLDADASLRAALDATAATCPESETRG
jgi:hypothetical protein